MSPFTVGSSSAIGKRKVNQDVLLQASPLHPDFPNVHLFAVLDGHGENGLQAAEYTKSKLLAAFQAQARFFADLSHSPDLVAETIRTLFESIDKDLRENESVDTYISGTTASLVLLWPSSSNYVVAHIGDSRIVLGKKIKSEFEACSLSIDHNCENEVEKQRLLKNGATVTPLLENGAPSGPPRIFKGTLPYPGLAVSRAFGDDVAKRLGVLSVPDIQTCQIQPDDQCLIIACDGVWDGLSNLEAVRIVLQHQQEPEVASKKLTEHSLVALDRQMIDDNVSNICIFFQHAVE